MIYSTFNYNTIVWLLIRISIFNFSFNKKKTMNYTETNSTITSYFTGSRRFSNIFWALAVSLGGFGFFLTGLSSFFKVNLLFFSNSSDITFIPQGIVLLFYGTVGSILGTFLFLTIWWNVGSGYNEYNKASQKVTLYRQGFPGKNRELLFNFNFLLIFCKLLLF